MFCLIGVLQLGGYNLLSQPNIEWQKSMGGTDQDMAESIKQTSDGGYVVVGTTISSEVPGFIGGADIWAIKLSATGEVEWQNCYGGLSSEEARDAVQTADGGYMIVGFSNGGGFNEEEYIGMDDFMLLKLDSNGEVEWQKIMGNTAHDRLYSVKQTADGGYITAGSSGGAIAFGSLWDYVVTKLDDSGNIQWEKALGGMRTDIAQCINLTSDGGNLTSDGGYIVAGYSYSNDGDITHHMSTANTPDYWIVKLDSTGEIEWEKALGGSSTDYAYSIQQTTDGGYIVAGDTYSENGNVTNHHESAYRDAWIVKLNNQGNLEWQKCIGGTWDDKAHSIIQTQDGGYVVAGTTDSDDGDVAYNHGPSDAWVFKLSETGNILWEKTFGGSDMDVVNSIIESADGGLVFAGISDSDDSDLSINYGIEDFWIVKLSGTAAYLSETTPTDQLSIYPNPGRERLTIETKETVEKFTTVSICDMQGRIILNQQINNGKRCEINTAQIAAGLYHVQVKNVESITSNLWIKE